MLFGNPLRAAATGTLKTGAADFAGMVFANAHATNLSSWIVYDNTSAAGKILFDVTVHGGGPPVVIDIPFHVGIGLHVVESGTGVGTHTAVEM